MKQSLVGILLIIASGVLVLVAVSCSPSSSPVQSQMPAESQTQTGEKSLDQSTTGGNQTYTQNPSDHNAASTADSGKQQTPADVDKINRVDIIYFHPNQRCVTCLCFEQNINTVIEKYFQDAIASGKLTYRVLNIQKQENADIVRKYRAVGSQLFVNTIIGGVDNIKDIQGIWNWKCETNPRGFQLKVKDIIDQSLLKIQR